MPWLSACSLKAPRRRWCRRRPARGCGDRVDRLAALLGTRDRRSAPARAQHGGVGLDAERVLVVLLEDLVVDGDVDHERDLAALGDGGDVEGDVALVGADEGDRALVDQPLRLALAGLGLALGVARSSEPSSAPSSASMPPAALMSSTASLAPSSISCPAPASGAGQRVDEPILMVPSGPSRHRRRRPRRCRAERIRHRRQRERRSEGGCQAIQGFLMVGSCAHRDCVPSHGTTRMAELL